MCVCVCVVLCVLVSVCVLASVSWVVCVCVLASVSWVVCVCVCVLTDHLLPCVGTPGSPLEMSITRTSSALTIHWLEGNKGAGPIIGYVIEARPSGKEDSSCPLHLLPVKFLLDFLKTFSPLLSPLDEGVWDSFVRLLPPSSRTVSVAMDRLRSGVGYEFRVIAVNRYGYGEPSSPSAALAGNHTHSYTLSLSHTQLHTLSLTHTVTHALSHTHSYTLSLSHTQLSALVVNV